MKVLYEKVVALIKEQNKTIHSVEVSAGIGNGTIDGWKNGSNPMLNSVIKVANELGVTIDQLISE